MITFSNPRLSATFADWPLGLGKRGTCVFQVHKDPKKGMRISRTTTGKPKFNTFAQAACIVDGSNGKTYLLTRSPYSPSITISRSDFMNATKEELDGDCNINDLAPEYATLNLLLNSAV